MLAVKLQRLERVNYAIDLKLLQYHLTFRINIAVYFSWFHGPITRDEAIRRLEKEGEGTYLVRNSESVPHNYSLSLRY